MRQQAIRGGLALLALVGAVEGHAAASIFTGTTADTEITNTATASYSVDSQPVTSVDSNTTSFFVDEVLDVTVAAQPTNETVDTPDTGQRLYFDVRNDGNGTEDMVFTLANTGDDFTPTVTSVVVDADGNDTFNAGTDTTLTPTGGVYTIPAMTPGQTLRVFVTSSIPTGLADGDFGRITLTASAFTAFDDGLNGAAAGTVIDGGGDGANGIDAIVGTTTATANDFARYLVSAVTVTIDKTIDFVTDPFGGSFDPQTPGVDPNYVPGSVVTYRLEVTVTGTGTAESLTITDAISALDGAGNGVLYVADSVTARGNGQTDESDTGGTNIAEVQYADLGNTAPTGAGDKTAANLDGGVTVVVDLGDVDAGDPTDVITFQVEIQ